MNEINSASVAENDTDNDAAKIARDWIEKDAQRAALGEAIRPQNKAALFGALAVAGITAVVVRFDGSCDSGQVEGIEAKIGDHAVDLPEAQIELTQAWWGNPNIERSAFPLRDAIDSLPTNFFEETHTGWEINDGAYGEFTFDVVARKTTLDYFERIADTDHSQHVF